jgi:3,5-dioxohexanoate:acetyl-CoA acetone transferase
MAKVIVTAALTGGGATPSMSPYLPITPQQLADEAVRAYEAGAAIAHVHVRNPETGEPSSKLEYFREIATQVKSRCPIVVCTTSGGTPDMSVEERARVVRALEPELATFNAGSMNFGIFLGADAIKDYKHDWEKPHLLNSENSIFPNTFKTLREFSQMFAETTTKPELEVYDSGMINNLAYLVQKGYLKKPLHLQFVLGTMGGLQGTVNNLNFLHNSAREAFGEFTWSTCATGRFEYPMCTVAMIMGGHCRVGLEDNLYVSKGVLAKSNAELVEKMVRIIREFGNESATPDEARKILGLKGLDKVKF